MDKSLTRRSLAQRAIGREKHHCFLVASWMGLVAVTTGTSIHAQDTVLFEVTGDIVGGCSIQNDNATIDLGQIPASALPSIGSFSGWKEGELISGGCTGVTEVVMTFSGNTDPNNPKLWAVTGGASGVGIELQSIDGQEAIPDNSSPVTWAPAAAGDGYKFQARYVRTGNVTPGQANGQATVNITYQ
jgi:type 1 fimbria pilin